ncbi:hypothetical protein E1283_25450 [Streptomyces hainanensis]|uniref:Uncharacterized protein n=1 Tax=Streptomyces hainanensis TaxID=402648 RepID=A0A4V2Y1S4_9ACTN|nr:hypothetical protein E1283_25450 [Streptomyces hainanensis]
MLGTDTKSTSGTRSTNTPNLLFFFSPYVITLAHRQPGGWPAPTPSGRRRVNHRKPPARWAR